MIDVIVPKELGKAYRALLKSYEESKALESVEALKDTDICEDCSSDLQLALEKRYAVNFALESILDLHCECSKAHRLSARDIVVSCPRCGSKVVLEGGA
jgi:RNase P subunit RPR2